MPTKSPRIAKLTRPRLHAVIKRARLFEELDAARARPVVWLAGQPGAGKTTLVATWLEARDVPDLWFQVDSGDADPATFFFYLGQCVQACKAVRKGRPLPLLAPEHLVDLPAFSRRFFREMFARFPANVVLVLDNFQELPDTSTLHAAIASAMAEVPERATLLVISRSQPSACYARLVANRAVSLIGAELLRLSLEETRAIVTASRAATTLTERLHQQSDGWAAGLTLMLERVHDSGLTESRFAAETSEATFAYFAGEVFDRSAPEHQQILLACAFLPRVSVAQAARVSGHPGAGRLLDELYRRHLFTDRRLDDEPVFQFHALFRDFLLRKAAEWYTDVGRAQIVLRGAQSLDEAGDVEGAFVLYAQAGAVKEAARVILQIAPSLLRQGRSQTLSEWILSLPQSSRESDPWLIYWLGTAAIPTRQSEAREFLERSLKRFEAAHDTRGQILSVCGIMEAHYLENFAFGSLRPWIGELETLVANHGPDMELELDVRSMVNLIVAGHFVRFDDPALEKRIDRAFILLDTHASPYLRVKLSHAILRHLAWSARFDRVDEVVSLTRPILDHPSVSVADRLLWWVRLSQCHLFAYRIHDAQAANFQANLIGQVIPYHPAQSTIACFPAWLGVIEGDIGQTRAALMRTLEVARDRGYERGVVATAQCILATHEGRLDDALECAERIVERFEGAGVPHAAAEFRVTLAYFLLVNGRRDEAAQCMKDCRAFIQDSYLAHYDICLRLLESYAALVDGEYARADALLADALSRGEKTTFWPLRWIPKVLPTILGRALERRIEPEFVRKRIRQLDLQPLENYNLLWPWPVKIYALGGFRLEVDDAPQAGRKPQHRLYDMLRLLVAQGGLRVPYGLLSDALWPDADGDAAQRNLEVYLTRLRKLLGHPEAVSMRDGRVQINSKICWLDTWAFEACCEHLDRMEPGDEAWEGTVRSALELYSGPLLKGESFEDYVHSERCRLHRRWTLLINRVVEVCHTTNRSILGREVLHHALSLEPGHEGWTEMFNRLAGT